MGRFVEAADRHQPSLLPACLEDYVDADNPVRVIDAFVDELVLAELGFERVQSASTGRPGYDPAMMLKLYVYGYQHQLASSRKLEREAGRNIELMWLTGKLAPNFLGWHFGVQPPARSPFACHSRAGTDPLEVEKLSACANAQRPKPPAHDARFRSG